MNYLRLFFKAVGFVSAWSLLLFFLSLPGAGTGLIVALAAISLDKKLDFTFQEKLGVAVTAAFIQLVLSITLWKWLVFNG